ncbi:MAG: hypothetical protein J6C44_01485 [Muribaculaceae bacterium]|nr:hypothetical protein [Muribaculaceae bacterium]
MAQEQKVKTGMATASMWCGIVAAVIGLAPFISGWFLLLYWAVWVLAILSIVFGVIAIVKKQPLVKPVVGMVLSVFGLLCPSMFAEQFAKNAIKSAGSAVSAAHSIASEVDAYDDLDF